MDARNVPSQWNQFLPAPLRRCDAQPERGSGFHSENHVVTDTSSGWALTMAMSFTF